MHDLPLITTIAVAFTAAWVLGLLTQRLGLSPIVGYLLAGVLIGPHTPGFVGDVHIAHQLAEVGVILLMFGVGLHFHLGDLLAVKNVAVPGAVGQSLVATLVSVAVFSLFGMPTMTGAVLGMAMAVASTVVLMRVLMDADSLSTPQGHVAVGWLLVEDVFTVIVLVLIPVLGQAEAADPGAGPAANLWASLGIALLKLAVLVAIVMVGGARVIPWTLVQIARLRSRELFTLTILVFSIAVAAAAYAFFGASMALGAFLAGMVVAQSPVSHQAAADALPMRDAFAVLFFVSVGMLFDPAFLFQEPLLVLTALGVILLIKPLAALAIVALLGHSVRTALTVALGLAQIGEFSFILSELARKHRLMPDSGHNVLVASAIISITLNPILYRLIAPCLRWQASRRGRTLAPRAETAPTSQFRAVVIGYGPTGRTVARLLRENDIEPTIIEMNLDTVRRLQAEGEKVVYGDASHVETQTAAGVATARSVVLTVGGMASPAEVIRLARELNPRIQILARSGSIREQAALKKAGANFVFSGEAEVALALTEAVLRTLGATAEQIERERARVHEELVREPTPA